MRISTLPVLVLWLIACVAGASLQPFFLGHRLQTVSVASFGQGLQRRQISVPSESSVPSQCASSCNPVNDEISLGCPVTACCAASFEQEYYNCLACVGMALSAGNYSSAQNNLNLLYTTCVDIGYVLPQLALPGQTASGSNSSTGAHPASTGAGSPPSASPSSSTGAAISGRWGGMQMGVLIGTAVLLGVAGLW